MGPAEHLERTAELQQLSSVLASAGSGRGQVCVIEGPSGIGKSRLLDECAGCADARGMTVLRARCSELTRDHPFGATRDLFEALLVRADPGTRTKLMRGPAALAEPVFGNGAVTDGFGVLHGLYWLTVNLAEQGPLAILVDDLPWADEFSLRFFGYIAERLSDLAVALVVTIRSGDPRAKSPSVNHVWNAATSPTIRPIELTADAVGALLADALETQDVNTSLARDVVRATGGNPFLVVAVAGAMRAGEDPELSTPESVRRHIARRLARLDPAARMLAEACSVLGDGAALTDGIRLAGLDAGHGRAVAEELILGRFLASVNTTTFAHRLVRTAIYDLLDPRERLSLHVKAAKLLAANGVEPEVTAKHLLLTGPIREAWAQEILQAAGRAATQKGAHTAALRYLRRAAEIAGSGELHPRALIDLGLAEAAAGEPTSLRRFERALELSSEVNERGDALYSLGQTLHHFGRYAEAGVAFHRGALLVEGVDQQARLRFEGAAWSSEAHLAPTQRGPGGVISDDGRDNHAMLAVEALRQSLTTPPATRAADLAIRALGDGALLAEQGSQGPSVNHANLALLHSGRLIEAHQVADATVRDARDHAEKLAFAEASLVRALVLYARGRITDASADAHAAVDGFENTGHAHTPTALAILANCMIERGELTGAVRIFGRTGEELAQPPANYAYVRLARARMNLWRADIEAARRDLDEAENALGDLGAENPSLFAWRSLAGVVAHLSGDQARSRSLIDDEIRLAQSFDVPIALGIALNRRAYTETGDQALTSLRAAVSVLEPTEAKLELARAHAGLGRGLRRVGQRIDARRNLGVGLDLAHRCGATRLEGAICQELTAAGGRPRRPSVSGAESLTPTELRVARLAASGLSNPEIAEQAFVSRNTVVWHLRNTFRKLQIESREQLSPHLDTLGMGRGDAQDCSASAASGGFDHAAEVTTLFPSLH